MTAAPILFDPAIGGKRIHRNRRAIFSVAAGSLGLIITPPITSAISAGSEAYEKLHTSFPGLDVAVSTGAAQAAADLFAALTVGALLMLLFFRDAHGKTSPTLGFSVEMRVLQVASAGWATMSAAMVLMEMLDTSGFPFGSLASPDVVPFLYGGGDAPKAWTISAVAASVAFAASIFAERWNGLLIALWATGFGVLAPVVVGQTLVGPNHDFANDAGAIQTLLTTTVFGLSFVAALRVASGHLIAPIIVLRLYKTMVLTTSMIIVFDVLLTWFKLAGTGLFDSSTGWQITARWVCLVALAGASAWGWFYWQQRSLTDRRINRILALCTAAGSGWIGVTAGMARIPPPHYFQPTTITQILLGYNVEQAPTAAILFTEWRPNVLFLVMAATGVLVYLLAVRTLIRRGDKWPVGRTVSWLAGWATVVFATSSGFGKYSAPDFGIHMIVHMSLNMLAPILLVMGGVLTLLLRAATTQPGTPVGLHFWITQGMHWPVLRLVYNPLVVFALFVGSYYGLYFSGIFGEYMRFHWAHQLMNVHFLIAGYLFYSLVIGVDRPPRPLPHIGKLGFVFAAMPFHAFFGVILMSSTSIIAENFYRSLALPWSDLPSSQYFGGGVAWAGGELPLLLVIISLGIQWSRQDAKDARRKDRHLDEGRDDEYEAYNRMLDTLAARQETQLANPLVQRREKP